MARTYPTTPMCDGELLGIFEPTTRDSDVFVSTSAKCGQTWLQSLLFHLKTGGREPDFRGLGLHGVSPWLEIPGDFGAGYASREERMAQLEALDDPRVFKLHVLWDEIPRAPGSRAKIMTITRDPRDVPYSMFEHLQLMQRTGNDGVPDTFDAYFERWMEFGYYYKFVASFWPHKGDPDVLWLRYEDMHADLPAQARRIVEFLDWDVTDEDMARALPLVDFEHMRAQEKSKIFRDASRRWRDDKNFFREGGVGKNRERLSAEQEKRIVDRLRVELPRACCEFLLGLEG